MQLFPFLAWLPVLTSVVMLVQLFAMGDLGIRSRVVLVLWFAAAAWAQFWAASAVVSAVGLAFQSLLAVVLIVRWRL